MRRSSVGGRGRERGFQRVQEDTPEASETGHGDGGGGEEKVEPKRMQ